MDAKYFDTLTRALSEASPRRGLLGLLATLPLLGGLFALIGDGDETEAKGRRKRRKKRHKHGRPRSHGKRKKKKCKPKSLTKTCEGKCGPVKNNCKKTVDCGACACETHAQCGVDALCLADGSCQACTVTCPSGDPTACGAALQTALEAGGTVYVCPGTYQGGFSPGNAVTVIGAGDGDDAASNTILDGNNAARVVLISGGTGTVELEQVRITRGAVNGPGAGAGIHHQGVTLLMRDCTVIDNRATGSTGGGIETAGTLTLTDCRIEGNNATFGGGISQFGGLTRLAGSTEVRGNTAGGGGGIFVNSGTLEIGAACRVTNNTALTAGHGGGIANISGTVTLEGADPSPIVVNNCPLNCFGTVPKCAPGGTCPP